MKNNTNCGFEIKFDNSLKSLVVYKKFDQNPVLKM